MSEERNCTKCKHKKKVRIPMMGFCGWACELWDCEYEPKEVENETDKQMPQLRCITSEKQN